MYDGACMLLFTSKKTFKKESRGQKGKIHKRSLKDEKDESIFC